MRELAHGFFARETVEAFRAPVPEQNTTLDIPHHDLRQIQGLRLFQKRTLHLLSGSDVARNLRRPNYCAGFILDRRDRYRYVDSPAVLADAFGFEMLDPFASINARE